MKRLMLLRAAAKERREAMALPTIPASLPGFFFYLFKPNSI
jgi:hypothetical protein